MASNLLECTKKQKLQQKLPKQKQGQDIESLFGEYQQTLQKLQQLQHKIGAGR